MTVVSGGKTSKEESRLMSDGTREGSDFSTTLLLKVIRGLFFTNNCFGTTPYLGAANAVMCLPLKYRGF